MNNLESIENAIIKCLGFLLINPEKGLTKSGLLNIIISSIMLPVLLLVIDIRVLILWGIALLLTAFGLAICIIIQELIEAKG